MEETIQETKDLMGGIITKPKMSDKLLNKPPFRFLHDIVTAVMGKTGFAVGLYDEEDLNSGNVKDKDKKIAFLEKIIACVSHAQGVQLDVKPGKVVAGLEPEFTNKFLQEYAKAAGNPDIDSAEAVKRTLAGDPPGSTPLLKGSGGASESKEPAPAPAPEPVKEVPAEAKVEDPPPREDPPPKASPPKSTQDDHRPREDPPSKDAKPTRDDFKQPAPQGGGGGGWDFSECTGDVETTKKLVGNLISRPKMSDKLLNKPPFRFLHDVVIGLINNTAFAPNLFDEEMSDSANVKDKSKKIAFLERLINLASLCAKRPVDVRAAKVVAGLEPENTNVLLQMLAVIAGSGVSCAAEVDRVLSGDTDIGSSPAPSPAPAPAPAPTPADMSGFVMEQPEPAQAKPTRAPEAKSESKPLRDEPPAIEAKAEAKASADPFNPNAVAQAMAQESKMPLNDGDGGERKQLRTARPTTARRRPPKLRENVKEVESAAHREIKNAPTVGILADGADSDDDELVTDENDLGSQVPFGDLPTGGQHGKLVQDILSAEAKKDEEQKQEVKEEKKEGGGIRLGRLGKKKAAGVGKATLFSESDIAKLRGQIQLLCQSTNPLGKCMDYVNDDLDTMTKELERWRQEYRNYCKEMESESAETDRVLEPLSVQLVEVREQVEEQVQKISMLKASISQNDERVQQLLQSMGCA